MGERAGTVVRGPRAALVDVAMAMAESGDAESILDLALAAAPALAPCLPLGVWDGDDWAGDCPAPFGATAVRHAVENCLRSLPPRGGRLAVDGHGWAFAYGLETLGGHHGYLVLVSPTEPAADDDLVLSLLALQTALALAAVRRLTRQREVAYELSRANTALSRLVHELQRTVEIHARLDDVAASGRGQAALAATLHELTGFPVLIEDGYGNLQAHAPVDQPPDRPDRLSAEERDQLIRQLAANPKPLRRGPRIVTLAAPRYDVVGLLSLVDPDGMAGTFELVALEHGATVLAAELARLASVAEAELRVGGDLLEDLVAGRDPEGIFSRAQAVGYDLGRPQRVAFVHGAAGPEPDHLLAAVRRAARRAGFDAIAARRPAAVLLLAAGDVDWAAFQAAVGADLPTAHLRVAVGAGAAQPADVPRSLREAQLARALQDWPGAPAVLAWEDLGVYRMLSSLDDVAGLERFVEEQLGPLIRHDGHRQSNLVETLHLYLECGASHSAAAKELGVHPSTVKYRVQRAREIGGYDLSSPVTRFNLQLAASGWRVLRALSAGPAASGAGAGPPGG